MEFDPVDVDDLAQWAHVQNVTTSESPTDLRDGYSELSLVSDFMDMDLGLMPPTKEDDAVDGDLGDTKNDDKSVDRRSSSTGAGVFRS